ncbi:hypothetical protein ACFQH9_02785 [Pseudonocardia lutea]|uniref:Secreted protein n=1 Tax=Pseudonocardia lutea TaxID=2172015 RepID=A0ABW1I471_9PSEU
MSAIAATVPGRIALFACWWWVGRLALPGQEQRPPGRPRRRSALTDLRCRGAPGPAPRHPTRPHPVRTRGPRRGVAAGTVGG